MHPAYSVLAFTTLSGAGYGLLIWLSVALLMGGARTGSVVAFVMLAVGVVLVSVGLLSSMLHLGRPERAHRAFSQWRTSWLSREGVLALATYVPAVGLGVLWLQFAPSDRGYQLLALLLGLGSVATVWCTGMIYASLTTIRAWHHPLVAPGYVILALATGGVLFVAIRVLAGVGGATEVLFALAALLSAWAVKTAYWGAIDSAVTPLTPGRATGLEQFGDVRVLEPPHTGENFVMREMGYAVARRHAAKLRQLSVLGLFVVPIVCLLMILIVASPLAILLAAVATFSAAFGVFAERWLFFAEARHVVTLYYGAKAA